MSTPNFSAHNRIFVAPESNEEYYNDNDREMLEDSIIIDLRDEFSRVKGMDVETAQQYDDDRSYPGTIFAHVEYTHHLAEDTIIMRAPVVFRGGYYSGANIDYYVEEPEFEGSYENVPEYKYLEAAKARMLSGIERVLKQNCTPLRCLGVFSNGEAIYELA